MSDENTEFVADGATVYGFSGADRIVVATAVDAMWAQTIAETLTADPDVYIAF